MRSYDVEFSFTAPDSGYLNMASTTVEVDHPVETSDDVREIAAEIGRQNGYTSVKIEGIAESHESVPTAERPVIE